ncbi:MAG: Flp family type IVb pilin [Erythrobacter sp.]|uniref:Flp family type IVb pilin n=1 Tax=Erythrobacter sp. TaxID=1042 RepID=UPI0032677AC7
MKLTNFLKHIGNDNSGATAVEYALIASLVVITMIASLQGVAQVTDETWDLVRDRSVEAMSNQ